MDKDSFDRLYLLSQWCLVAGSLLVAVLAVFGEPIRGFFFRPQLRIRLNSIEGELVFFDNGQPAVYYHLRVTNLGPSAAKNAWVVCHDIAKRTATGEFKPEPMAAPERLSWRYPQLGRTRDIPPGYVGKLGEVCDLGYVHRGATKFRLAPYAQTDSFPGFLTANQAMKVSLSVAADNFTPKEPYMLEITWDGTWTENLAEMQTHLILKEL